MSTVAGLDLDAGVAALVARGVERELAVELLEYARAALQLDRLDIIRSYVAWRARRATHLGAPGHLPMAVGALHDLAVPPEWRPQWQRLVERAGEAATEGRPDSTNAPMFGQGPGAALASAYLRTILQGERRQAVALVLDAVDRGLSIPDLYMEVFQPVLEEVGRRWETNRLTVGQEHYCSAVTQSIMAQLYPRLFQGEPDGPCLVAASTQGNLHQIGIRMLADLMELDGWDTHFLGSDLPVAEVTGALRERKADALALSVTLSSQLPAAADTIRAVREIAELSHVAVLIGGRAVLHDPSVVDHVGADAWAPTAAAAVHTLNQTVERAR